MADIFVSYTSSDRDWAFWIGQELEKLGHIPRIHEWEISAGGDIPAWMEERLQKADHVLLRRQRRLPDQKLFRLGATVGAMGCRKQSAELHLAGIRRGLRSASRQWRISNDARCSAWRGRGTDAARRLFGSCASGRRTGQLPRRGQVRAIDLRAAADSFLSRQPCALSNIPIGVPRHFIGRDDELEAIDAALTGDASRVAVAALHGLRGVGKTTLAAAYAERQKARLPRDLVDQGADARHDARRSRCARRAPRLGRRRREGGACARQRFASGCGTRARGCCLIYDNAIDAASLRPYLPTGGAARALVTSNSPAWRGVAAPVEIRLWSKEVGAEYLIARTGTRQGAR